MAGWYKSHPVIFFVGLFALQMLVFYFLFYNNWVIDHLITPFVNIYAKTSSALLNIFGYHTTATGDALTSQQFSVVIKRGCDALEPMALFVSGLVAFPSTIKKKAVGLSLGLFALFLLNIIRICTLFITGIKSPKLFDIMHEEVWQVIFIIIAIVMWYFWLLWSMRKKPAA